MSVQTQINYTTKKVFWTIAIFYMLMAFEFFYMASPFAIYFYSAYGPGLNFINNSPTLAWLSSLFLPHIVVETSSALLNLHNILGAMLACIGFLAFCIGAGQVYYHKLTRKGAVTGGIYNFIRHPQYLALTLCSFGLLLLWPRYIVLLSFIMMLFIYYLLTRAEETECEKKFGEAYVEYKNKTGMFLPFHTPFMEKLPGLPKSGVKRCLAIVILYVAVSLIAIGLANGLKSWSLNSLYALYSRDAVYISVTKIEKSILEQMVKFTLTNPDVQRRLTSSRTGENTKFINYILPIDLYVSEIPMNPVEGIEGHHFIPSDFHKDFYKIIFTRAEGANNHRSEGKDILLNTSRRVPIVEVWVDLSQKRVIDIRNPPATTKYGNIPMPIY